MCNSGECKLVAKATATIARCMATAPHRAAAAAAAPNSETQKAGENMYVRICRNCVVYAI